jgi:hypothetical protein
VFLYDIDGRELWRRVQPRGSWCTAATKIDWHGGGSPECVLLYSRAGVRINLDPAPGEPIYWRDPGTPDAVMDGEGTVVDEFEMQFTADRSERDRRMCVHGLAADLWGDSRQEAVLFGSRGLCVFANARPLPVATHYNETLYTGM